MILELFENIARLPMILIILYMVIITIIEAQSGKLTTVKAIKLCFCVVLSIAVCISILVIILLEVYQVAIIWKEYEIEHTLDPRIKSISFTAIELIWSLLGAGLMFLLWHFIYFKQIISGVGGIKMRLKSKLKMVER